MKRMPWKTSLGALLLVSAGWIAGAILTPLTPARAGDQPPTAPEQTLEARVARLEREVAQLRSVPSRPESLSPGGEPFQFNERTYYYVPLEMKVGSGPTTTHSPR